MAVFECKTSWHQLGADDVNHIKPMMGYKYNEALGKYHSPHVVGSYVDSDYYSGGGTYLFREGAKHNRLTLTNGGEIQTMRAYIESRKDDFITEVAEV